MSKKKIVIKTSPSSPHDTTHENQLAESLTRQLNALLSELVVANLLTEQDKRILSLRIGLEDGKCYTLNEVAKMLHKSSELIRTHQYSALKRHTRDPIFFKLLSDYACVVKLPKGVNYYLQQQTTHEDLIIPQIEQMHKT